MRLRGQATAAVYRALATLPGAGAPRDMTGGVDLPRGQVDALAMRTRFSDARDYARFEPAPGTARRLFSMLEQNRVEALGARAFAGIRCNLAALAEERWIRARPEAVIRGVSAAWIETFALLARVPLGAPLPESALRVIALSNGRWMSGAEHDALIELARLLDDQRAFSIQSLRLIDVVLESVSPVPPIRPTPDESADETAPHPTAGARGEQGAERPGVDAEADRDDVADSVGPVGDTGAAYRVYTDAFDVEASADEWVDATALLRLRAELDRHLGHRMSDTNRWAHRLRRRLMSLQSRAWQFDCDEGELDASRLTRIATRPLEPLVYRRERESEFPGTVVTLLVDNSGSMRGGPIATAAACAELLGRVLEKCSVKTEILGFTTRNYRGGFAHQQWVSAGRVPDPGRLTDLRHIIYKSADEQWQRARGRMGAMLDPEMLKENVDGEALLWAYHRLRLHPEPRKILIVISDGAPLDEMTLQANDPGYLDRHLREVVTMIERGPVKLAAIGIGHDVTRYYRRAVVLNTVDELGEAIVTELFGLLDRSKRKGVAA